MKTDQERRDNIRDEMLIDMARGIQFAVAMAAGYVPPPTFVPSAVTIIGRLESHIGLLKGAK